VPVKERPGITNGQHVNRVIAIVALASLPLAVDALDLTGLPAGLAEKV
jgi:hypothetical protein